MELHVNFEDMSTPAKKRASYAEIEALPRHMVGQIIDGELIAMPRPTGAHSVATSFLGGDLVNPFGRGRGGPGGWWILDEPELHFGDDVLVPDLAGWRRSRLPDPSPAFFTVAPDWICEVLSPSTARHDRVGKLRIYGREGVEHVWLVDPDAHTLECLKRDGETWSLLGTYADDERVRATPFDAVEIELSGLWLPQPVDPR